jgi:hypothetical protein
MDAANRALRQIDDDLDESIIPVPPLRLRSRGAGSYVADIRLKLLGILESIPRRRHRSSPRRLRICNLALARRDFTADSEMPNVFAIWAIEASS